MLVDSSCTSILNRCNNHFSVTYRISQHKHVRQTAIRTAQPQVSESSCFEFEIIIESLKYLS